MKIRVLAYDEANRPSWVITRDPRLGEGNAMNTPDFNLLLTLDALLDEGSVAGAARRLSLSPSAMSRALARLRETTGDPLLVRAGRGLVPTPRALALRAQVSQLVQEAEAVLRPQQEIDPAHLVRTFRLRSSDGFVESVGAALLARLAAEAGLTHVHMGNLHLA